jgi:hypothetical protein
MVPDADDDGTPPVGASGVEAPSLLWSPEPPHAARALATSIDRRHVLRETFMKFISVKLGTDLQ